MINIKILLIIFIFLIVADKVITIANIKQVEKNYNVNPLKIEKNPIQKFFFNHAGLYMGAFLYGLFSLITIWFAFLFLGYFWGDNKALWFIMIIYGAVIFNNIHWFLIYSKII
jgi:hypothetical protein